MRTRACRTGYSQNALTNKSITNSCYLKTGEWPDRLAGQDPMAECSCRGGNPNCFKCGGLGASSLAGPGQTREKTYGELLSSLEAIARERPRKWRVPKQLANPPLCQQDGASANATGTCSICGSLVKVKNLSRHNRKVHSGPQPVARSPKKSRRPSGAMTYGNRKNSSPSVMKSAVDLGSNSKRRRGGPFVQGGLCNGR